MYGIRDSDSATSTSPNNLTGTITPSARQAFVTFSGHEYAESAIAAFNTATGENASIAKSIRGKDLSLFDPDVWLNGSHNLEPNMDAQFLSSIGKGAETYQWFTEPGKWWLGFTQEVIQMANASNGERPPLPR